MWNRLRLRLTPLLRSPWSPSAAFCLLLFACSPGVDETLPDKPKVDAQTIEIRSPGEYYDNGNLVSGSELRDAIVPMEAEDAIRQTPLRIVVPESLVLGDLNPVFRAAFELDTMRTNVTIAIKGTEANRQCTWPVPYEHGCGALAYFFGSFAYDDHGESPRYVYALLSMGLDKQLVLDGISYKEADSFQSLPWEEAPLSVRSVGPTEGQPITTAALRDWFESLKLMEFRPFVRIQYSAQAKVGPTVDLLSAVESAVGSRVIFQNPTRKEPIDRTPRTDRPVEVKGEGK